MQLIGVAPSFNSILCWYILVIGNFSPFCTNISLLEVSKSITILRSTGDNLSHTSNLCCTEFSSFKPNEFRLIKLFSLVFENILITSWLFNLIAWLALLYSVTGMKCVLWVGLTKHLFTANCTGTRRAMLSVTPKQFTGVGLLTLQTTVVSHSGCKDILETAVIVNSLVFKFVKRSTLS